jgi:hypothetical protein
LTYGQSFPSATEDVPLISLGCGNSHTCEIPTFAECRRGVAGNTKVDAFGHKTTRPLPPQAAEGGVLPSASTDGVVSMGTIAIFRIATVVMTA